MYVADKAVVEEVADTEEGGTGAKACTLANQILNKRVVALLREIMAGFVGHCGGNRVGLCDGVWRDNGGVNCG